LHKAVVSDGWEMEELSRTRTSECTLEEDYQAIQGAIQIHTEPMEVYREEYQNVVEEMRVKASLIHNVPAAADMQYK
jgi:hypothetical protein